MNHRSPLHYFGTLNWVNLTPNGSPVTLEVSVGTTIATMGLRHYQSDEHWREGCKGPHGRVRQGVDVGHWHKLQPTINQTLISGVQLSEVNTQLYQNCAEEGWGGGTVKQTHHQ